MTPIEKHKRKKSVQSCVIRGSKNQSVVSMSDIAIRVESLSKRYRIGLAEERHDTLAGALTAFLRQPAKNLRRLTTFDDSVNRSNSLP